MKKQTEKKLTILRRQQVEQRTGMSRSGIYAAIAQGEFPEPIRLTDRAVGWIEHEIEAWINERISQRDKAKTSNAG